MSKKSIKLDELLNIVNTALARTDDYADNKFKAGICHLWEKVAFEKKAYNGFNNSYWLKKGAAEWFADGQPAPEIWAEHEKKYIIGEGPGTSEYNRTYF